MSKYEVVVGGTDKHRAFKIVVGLQEGYNSSGITHHHNTAKEVLKRWVKARAKAGLPYLTGEITLTDYLFGHGSGDAANVDLEPAIKFEGHISNSYLARMQDEAIVQMLNDLASELADSLGQDRIELAYQGRAWAIQRPRARRTR